MRRGFVSTSFFLWLNGFSPHLPFDPRHEEIDDAPLPPGGNLDPARHFPPQRAKLPDEVSGVRHRDNRVRSTEKPPPAMSLTEARRNQSSVSARSVIVLSRIRRTLVCLARRNAASRRTLHATSLTSDANSGSGSGSIRRMFIKHRAPRSTCTRSTLSSSSL